MARTALTANALNLNSNIADPTGQTSALGAGNGVQLANVGSSPVILRVANASGGSGTISLLAGSQPLAPSSGLGNLTVTVANSSTQWIGPFESAQFLQNDGSYILESSVAMTVTAFLVDGKHSA